jgi:hypothetical protein
MTEHHIRRWFSSISSLDSSVSSFDPARFIENNVLYGSLLTNQNANCFLHTALIVLLAPLITLTCA